MKKIVIITISLVVALNVYSQRFIERTVDITKDVVGVFTPDAPAPTVFSTGFPGKDPSNVNATEPGVPIVESILGLFGLGAVYAFKIIRKKKNN